MQFFKWLYPGMPVFTTMSKGSLLYRQIKRAIPLTFMERQSFVRTSCLRQLMSIQERIKIHDLPLFAMGRRRHGRRPQPIGRPGRCLLAHDRSQPRPRSPTREIAAQNGPAGSRRSVPRGSRQDGREEPAGRVPVRAPMGRPTAGRPPRHGGGCGWVSPGRSRP